MMKKWKENIFYLFFPIIMGSIVGIAVNNFMDYKDLVQPLLAPPSFLFPVMWSIIYLLMGISYFIYRKEFNSDKTKTVYYIQLFVNLLWSIIFFVWKLRLLAVFWIILLDILVIWLIILFLKEKKISAYLNIPYLIWILFATYLTTAIYFLN